MKCFMLIGVLHKDNTGECVCKEYDKCENQQDILRSFMASIYIFFAGDVNLDFA